MKYHLFINETGIFGKRTKVKQSSFTLVHRLCICALALSQNMDIIGEETLKIQLLVEDPTFLCMKWLGVIYALKGDFETTLSLFERGAGDKEIDGFTIDVIKLPIKILVHFCRKRASFVVTQSRTPAPAVAVRLVN